MFAGKAVHGCPAHWAEAKRLIRPLLFLHGGVGPKKLPRRSRRGGLHLCKPNPNGSESTARAPKLLLRIPAPFVLSTPAQEWSAACRSRPRISLVLGVLDASAGLVVMGV